MLTSALDKKIPDIIECSKCHGCLEKPFLTGHEWLKAAAAYKWYLQDSSFFILMLLSISFPILMKLGRPE